MEKDDYGMELILDLHNCCPCTMTRKSIKQYYLQLCDLIDMEPQKRTFWDDKWALPWRKQTNPKTTGISAVQFIITSNVTVHALPLLKRVYINIFSCKEFTPDIAKEFSQVWFSKSTGHIQVNVRKSLVIRRL